MKLRIFELSKDLGLDNKALIEICQKIGIPVKSHSSGLDPVELERVKIALRAKGHVIPTPGAKPPPGRPGAPGSPSAGGAASPGDAKSPFTVKVIGEGGALGEQVRHVKLERVIRRGPGARRGPSGPSAAPGGPRRTEEAPVAARPRPEDALQDLKGKVFEVQTPISVKQLSADIGVKTPSLIKALMDLGVMATINQILDAYSVGLIGEKLGIQIKVKEAQTLEETTLAEGAKDRPEDLLDRAPVVTVMGHVDHGKTSLLDRIRKANVAAGEAGGITQHIGAYRVETPRGTIVFLDTPGHAAFTRMRARGANVTDIVILVVAADDGVMPQTEEALNHAKAASVPIIVAMTKMDKPEANPRRVKEQLARLELNAEDWGGKTGFIEVSSVTGNGVAELLERVHLEAEVLSLKANPNKAARGTVVEASMSEATGIVATVLVQEGTLRKGDSVVCGQAFGRVRSLSDDAGRAIEEAGPSTPVRLTGLSEVPEAGSKLAAVDDVEVARSLSEERMHKLREVEIARKQHVTLENLFTHLEDRKAKELNIVLKADVKGSVEVIAQSLQDLSTAEVKVRVLHQGVGAIGESDILLAHASDAIVVGFNVIAEDRAQALAAEHGVEIRSYQIIYKLTEDITSAIEGMLEPESKEVSLGRLEIRQIFHASKLGVIAGCMVTQGIVRRGASIRVVRDGKIVHDGKVGSLRRIKDDVREVKEGLECGLKIEGYDDVKPGDRLDVYEIQKVARRIEKAASEGRR